MKFPKRILREPLLQFLAIGGLIFLLFAVVDDTRDAPTDTIVVTPERIDRLAARYSAVWKRMPTDTELNALIDEHVHEEIYYREALALGLDRNDTIVRRRLRQKMVFLIDTGTEILEPATGELEAYLLTNEKTFRRSPHLAFEQIYLGETPTPESVKLSLSALRSTSLANLSTLGERSPLPIQLDLSSPQAVDGVFGKGFFGRLTELLPGMWAGPVESAYGVHLVRVGESLAARTPPLEKIRGDVLRDWKAAKAQKIRELHYNRLRARFVVEIRRTDTRTAENR